jgi:molybdenum-dependent DNA-binding transcriptional regulator ModE
LCFLDAAWANDIVRSHQHKGSYSLQNSGKKFMKPTIKQLEALYWAGKLGSFQAAAAHLHTSQSAIAKRIAELREIFQVRLIDPAYRHAKLTDHGQRLLAAAEEVLHANERLMERMGYPFGFTGVLRLGVSELVAVTWLPRLIQEVKLQHPQAVIELEVGAGGPSWICSRPERSTSRSCRDTPGANNSNPRNWPRWNSSGWRVRGWAAPIAS